MKFTERMDELNDTINKGNILSPSLSDREALLFIVDYLLGEDWCSPSPISTEQINTEIVHTILYKYSKEYKEEYDEWSGINRQKELNSLKYAFHEFIERFKITLKEKIGIGDN